MSEAICCTIVSCSCESFKPGKLRRRQCERCKHGWVAHALSKLKVQHLLHGGQVEIVHSSVVFDICSLMLYGTQAIPVRLKILLDRLFSVLKQEEVIQILNALDWTLQDYIRGYVLQDVTGRVLDRWVIMTLEEEMAALQQFQRFGETKSIVELMAVQDKESQAVLVPSPRTSTGIRAFIENNTHRSPDPLPGPSPPASGSIHHFENLISSMAFLLPFQYLRSLPAPSLGSTPGSFQPGDHTTIPNLSTGATLVGSSSAAFDSDVEKSIQVLGAATPKMETEDIPASDTYSDSPTTPSVTSDLTQMSPDRKMHSQEKGGTPGGGLKKGRVLCSACEKTFYDKGTLKIHYNAVHLKIKHRCTVQGCNMVFSSLRSRNRHSANPNPRLHLPMHRNGRDSEPGPHSEGEEEGIESQPVSSYVVSSSDSRLQSAFPASAAHSGILFPNLKTVQPVLPFYRSLVTPAELANTPGALPSLPLISSSSVPAHNGPAAASPIADHVPKKKSRKSSMPVKIEPEAIELVADGHSDQSPSPELGLVAQPDSSVSVCERSDSCYQDCSRDEEARVRPVHTGGAITSTSPLDLKLTRHRSPPRNGPVPPLENGSEPCETDYSSANGSLFRILAFRDSPVDRDDNSTPGTSPLNVCSDSGETLHCETYSQALPSPRSVETHHCNTQEQEALGSTVNGGNITFPSSQYRDRSVDATSVISQHRPSTNITPFPMALAGDPCGATNTVCPAPSVSRNPPTSLPQAPPLMNPTGQPSVIFKGHYRTGLVHPLSTEQDCSAEPAEGDEEEGKMEEAVLDLSVTSVSQLEHHPPMPFDSDVDSEICGIEEDSNNSRESSPSREGLSPKLSECPSPITCPACQKVYSNKSTFRAHYKTVHLRLLHKCKVPGCSTSFSSVRSRNRHSQNTNLHRKLIMASTPTCTAT